ncbi:hypothetical protein K1719_009211 [Acacia pycnantha]|nr:hypothetical protein K1719_009211 [Acacia pycnantha]
MHNPKLATEMDSCRSTALHLASAEGNAHIVKELLQVFDEACLYNHLETLQALVELELAFTSDLINFTSFDNAGNTVLHLAIMLKRPEVHIINVYFTGQ